MANDKKFLDSAGLSYLWSKLKGTFSQKDHEHLTLMDESDYDSELLNEDTRAVAMAGYLVDTENDDYDPAKPFEHRVSAGSTAQPVYFENGVPVEIDYTIEKSVPADAKFTDTTYDVATETTAGLMSADDKTILKQLVGGEGADTKTKQTLLAEGLDIDCPVILGAPNQKATTTAGTYFHTRLKYNDKTNTLTANISGRSDVSSEETELAYNKIISRGEQLVVNGNGMTGDNTNFSKWVFDGENANNSPGSFTIETRGTSYTISTDEFFPVNPANTYMLSIDAKSENALANVYSFLDFYDVDKRQISVKMHIHNSLSTTTLAQDLKPGDTVAYLNDVSGWDASSRYGIYLLLWNYTNSFGYTYPAGTYTRNSVSLKQNGSSYPATDMIDTSAKTVQLAKAYTGTTIPAGTSVSQGLDGGTYKYIALSNTKPPVTWKSYKGQVGGVDMSGKNAAGMFPPGTAYAKVGFIWNNSKADDQIWITNVSVTDVSSTNTTYKLTKSGSTITLTGSDGSKTAVSDANTTYENATITASGLMSKDDKATLDTLTTVIGTKVDKEDNKGLSTNDYTTDEKNKLAGIESGAQKNTVTGVKGNSENSYRTGNVNITKANIGLGNVDNTSDASKPVSTAQQTAINSALISAKAYTDEKIDALVGEGASTTLDTIGEISSAIEGNQDAIDLLNSAIGNKANASDLTSHTGNTTVHITATERTNWNAAKTHADSTHAPSNAQKNSDITKAEIEAKLTGTITSHTHNYAPASHTSDTTAHITSTDRTNWNAAKSHADSDHAPADAEKNTITGVKGGAENSYRTGQINITKANIGLGNVDNTSDANKPVSTAQQNAINAALESANEYTDETLTGIEEGIGAILGGMYGEDLPEEGEPLTIREIAEDVVAQVPSSAYGTCSTAAATAAKVVTTSDGNFALIPGSRVTVKFSATNTASNPTLNVDGTGAKSVWYGTSLITTGSLSYAGYANRPMEFVYDGTQYIFVGWSYNTSYSNASLGQGYGTCSTAAATVAKTVSLSSYTLATGGIVAVKFTNSVPASATMNINSKGAKPIYYKGAAITANIIEAGDVATFVYNGSYYHLLTVDRHRFFTTLIPYGAPISTTGIDLNVPEYMKVGNYYCSANATAKTLVNCPTAIAFMMQVYSPLSTTIDNETSKTYIYRVRKLLTYQGDEYIQYCQVGATAGTWSYGAWEKIINSSDAATTSKAGLMSADDKVKLNGIETGANKTTVDTAMSSSSTNPVQNKVVNTAIDTALTSAKAYTDEKFEAMGGVVPEYVKTEANRVAKNVQSHQNANTFTFLAISDAHYDKTNENIVNGIIHAGQAMDLIRNAVNIDFAVHLGDATWGSSVSGDETSLSVGREEIMEVNKIIAPAFRGIPNFRVHGNHDHLAFNYELNGNDYIDENELFASFGIYNRGATYPVGEKDRGYCYRDLDEFKLRVIVMNTNDIKGCTIEEMENPCMSGYQMQWFADSLDLSSKSDASEWSILIFSHQPLDFGISILCNNILKAYLEGGSYSNSRNGVDFSCNFAGKNAATVIGNIHGHNHNFVVDNLNEYVSGGTASPINIKRMCVPNACYMRSNERGEDSSDTDVFGIDFGEDISYHKTAGTANDTAFYVITVDTATKKMYLDHYGAGYSRITSYVVQGVTYTNLLPTAEVYTAGDHSALDGVGYKDGYYMTSNGGVGSAASGYTCTGAIPYTRKADGTYPTIYVKGADWTSVSQCRLYMYNTSKGIIDPANVGGNASSPTNINKYWTLTSLGDNYWKWEPTSTFNSSAVVNNQAVGYIGMSLKGSGANTIITLDEPIEEAEAEEDVILGGNWIPKSTTEYGGTEIYNGIGYKTNTRMNSSSQIQEQAGMCLSGWIPVKAGDVIRVKNITVEGSASSYIGRMDANGTTTTVLSISYLGDPDENGVYTMTVNDDISYTAAIRLSVGVIDETSILTINEEIV